MITLLSSVYVKANIMLCLVSTYYPHDYTLSVHHGWYLYCHILQRVHAVQEALKKK